jgi:hypothetical protein
MKCQNETVTVELKNGTWTFVISFTWMLVGLVNLRAV